MNSILNNYHNFKELLKKVLLFFLNISTIEEVISYYNNYEKLRNAKRISVILLIFVYLCKTFNFISLTHNWNRHLDNLLSKKLFFLTSLY